MPANKVGLLLLIGLIALAILQAAGCTQQEEAVELYLDGVMLTEFGENEKAVVKLQDAVRTDNQFRHAYSMLGYVYEQMEEYQKSVASYEKAVGIEPGSFNDYFNMGRVYEILEEFGRAVTAYVRACEIRPDNLPAHANTARCYYELADYARALEYGRRAAEIDPNVGRVQSLLADIHRSQADYEEAIRYYKRAMEIDALNVETMHSLALAYVSTGRFEPARELLNTVVRSKPDCGPAYQYLGYCCLRLDDYDSSIGAYEKAIGVDENDWQAHRGLGVACMVKAILNGDEMLKSRAVQHWRKSLELRPDQQNRRTLQMLIRKHSK